MPAVLGVQYFAHFTEFSAPQSVARAPHKIYTVHWTVQYGMGEQVERVLEGSPWATSSSRLAGQHSWRRAHVSNSIAWVWAWCTVQQTEAG